jgi:hypothetical protein
MTIDEFGATYLTNKFTKHVYCHSCKTSSSNTSIVIVVRQVHQTGLLSCLITMTIDVFGATCLTTMTLDVFGELVLQLTIDVFGATCLTTMTIDCHSCKTSSPNTSIVIVVRQIHQTRLLS